MTRCLVLVDIQNDFLPGGALAVPHGDEILPVALELIKKFDCVVATQDWHPADHASFASQHKDKSPGDMIDLAGLPQVLWPDHCVQGSLGAQFADELRDVPIDAVFQKGTDRQIDSYSGFFDNGKRKQTKLANWLTARSVSELCVVGLATDYCVKFTVLDALELGWPTSVVLDACRGVNLQAGDVARAITEMEAAGANIIDSTKL